MTKITTIEVQKVNKKPKKCQGCADFFYNKKDHSFCSRTASSWVKILCYFTIFYSVILGIFGIMISVFIFNFIDPAIPYRSGDNSLLRFRAGTNVYPRLDVNSATVIICNKPTNTICSKYITAATIFFNNTFNRNSSNTVNCPTTNDQPINLKQICQFTKEALGPCKDPIGQMNQNNICLYIRVNKVFGWLPKVNNSTTSRDILVSCNGQNPGDISAMGKPAYYPSFTSGSRTYGVIETKYFPFINQTGYISPMAAVQFPNMKPNIAILTQCQIANLDNSFQVINFEIMVYDPKV